MSNFNLRARCGQFFLFTAACLLFAQALKAQTKAVIIDPQAATKAKAVHDLMQQAVYGKLNNTSDLVANYAFRDTLLRFFNQVSGTVIKGGQVQSTSAVLDDKSLTISYTIPSRKPGFISVQPTITGTSGDGLIELFTGNKFKRTLTGGFNINMMFCGTASYNPKKRPEFLLKLRDLDDDYLTKPKDFKSEKGRQIDALISFCEDTTNNVLFDVAGVTNKHYKDFFEKKRTLHVLIDKLQDLYNEALDTADVLDVQKFAVELKANTKRADLIQYAADQKELKWLDSLQAAAPFSHFRFIWLTLSPKVNQRNAPIYAPDDPDNDYTRTQSDFYGSLSASFNILWAWKKFKFMVYPGISINNAVFYDPKDSVNLSIQKNYLTGNDQLKRVTTTAFYPLPGNRQWAKSFSLPFIFYWTKGFGIDAGMKYSLLQPGNDFNAHVGFFFNVAKAGGESLVLEPLLKYENDKSKSYDHNFDKFILGFSLSFALPAYLSGK